MATWKDFVKTAQLEFYSGPGYIPDSLDKRYQKEFNKSLSGETYDPNSESNLSSRLLNNLAFRAVGKGILEAPVDVAKLVGGVGGLLTGQGYGRGAQFVDSTLGDFWRDGYRDVFTHKIPIKRLLDADFADADRKMRDMYIGPERDNRLGGGLITDKYDEYKDNLATMRGMAQVPGEMAKMMVSWPLYGKAFDLAGKGLGLAGRGIMAGGRQLAKIPAVARGLDAARAAANSATGAMASKVRPAWDATKSIAKPVWDKTKKWAGPAIYMASRLAKPVAKVVKPVLDTTSKIMASPVTWGAVEGFSEGSRVYADNIARNADEAINNAIQVVSAEYDDAVARGDKDAQELAEMRLDRIVPGWRSYIPNTTPNASAPESWRNDITPVKSEILGGNYPGKYMTDVDSSEYVGEPYQTEYVLPKPGTGPDKGYRGNGGSGAQTQGGYRELTGEEYEKHVAPGIDPYAYNRPSYRTHGTPRVFISPNRRQ